MSSRAGSSGPCDYPQLINARLPLRDRSRAMQADLYEQARRRNRSSARISETVRSAFRIDEQQQRHDARALHSMVRSRCCSGQTGETPGKILPRSVMNFLSRSTSL